MKPFTNRPNGFLVAGYVYLLLPFVIFCIGWLRWYFALPLLAVTGLCFYLALGNTPALDFPRLDKAALWKVLAGLALICALVYICGIGGLVWQNPDQPYRNETFRILVERPWPVLRAGQGLVYYFGFWLPPALIGKLFGLAAGFAAQMVWAALGLCILFGLLCAWRRKVALWPLVLFLLFSGLDSIGVLYASYLVRSVLSGNTGILSFPSPDHWGLYIIYPSLLSNLCYAFHQAIPVYVLALVLLLQKNSRSYAFLAAPVLLSGTMAVMGMAPVGLALACSAPAGEDPIDRRLLTGRDGWTAAARDVCSLQNLLGGGAIALVMLLFLGTNHSGNSTGSTVALMEDPNFLSLWLATIVIEYGIYCLLIVNEHRRNPLLLAVFLTLAAAPGIAIGSHYDFTMRVSMAVLPFLALLVMDTLVKARRTGNKKLLIALLIALAISFVSPLSEIVGVIQKTPRDQRYEKQYVAEYRIFTEGNFSGNGSGNLFFDVLCKKG